MNEQSQGFTPFAATVPSADFRDRSTGLVVFGILTILVGGVCALFVPLMLIGQLASGRATGMPLNFSMIVPGISLYGILAVALVWLGIGSIMARRWARALLLIFSWSWLAMGVVMLVVMAFVMPSALRDVSASEAGAGHPAMPEGMIPFMMAFMLGFFAVFFVIVPGVFAFFYGSRHVKATCEARYPWTCWTDACPLPVLAASLWLMAAMPMMLIMALAGQVVMPFFGEFLTGMPAAGICVALAAVYGYGAWAMYKLKRHGWWLVVIVLCGYLASSLLTFARHDVMEMYRLMCLPEAQIQQLQNFSFISGGGIIWIMVLCTLPWFGYLIYIERFFRSRPQAVESR